VGRISLHINGLNELRAELRALGGPKLRKVARKVTLDAMGPVLATAKELAPVQSGQLRASIGRLAHRHKRGNAVSARVGTRRDFTFRDTEGAKMAQGRGKAVERAVSKGARLTKYSAQQYARGIEFGVDKRGRVRRRAGPAHFLERAITQHTPGIASSVEAGLRRAIETTKP